MSASSSRRPSPSKSSSPEPSVPAASSSSKELPNPEHLHRRYFIGPIPEKILSGEATGRDERQKKKKKKRKVTFHTADADADEDAPEIFKQLARHIFIREGGNEQEFGEHEEQSVREEMLRRWKQTEWGSILSRRKKETPAQPGRWIGGSFEVGSIFGLNILDEATESLSRPSSSRAGPSSGHLSYTSRAEDKPPLASTSTAGANTFVTAPSSFPDARQHNTSGSTHDSERPQQDENGVSTTSLTPLFRPISERVGSSRSKAHTEVIRRPILKVPPMAKSDSAITKPDNGKKKLVHYADTPCTTPPPASPAEVLERTGDDVNDTSAGAMTPNAMGDEAPWGDVVMRDRMLVRVKYTDSESALQYDEGYSRTARDLEHEDWGEFLVVWRKDRIELYNDYKVSMTEWFIGHKHLAYIINFTAPRTRLSLYSFVDLSFSITCQPISPHRFSLSGGSGTNIFVFKPKSRSRAYDWLWHLWRRRGGDLPDIIQVWNPSLNAKVKIDLPFLNTTDAYKMFTNENIIALCMQSLRSVSDYKNVIERQIAEGKVLKLAWRIDTTLDWVWLDQTVEGKDRPWDVLCGLALRQSQAVGLFQTQRPAFLEIRLGTHFPNLIRAKNGKRLVEPPAIEGYLDRIRPVTHTKEQVYLATHDGNIFTLSPAQAHPPSPVGLKHADKDMSLDEYAESLRLAEVARGARQIQCAMGASDLRNILLVRRAFQIIPEPTHQLRNDEDGGDWAHVWAQNVEGGVDNDDDDVGGEEAMAASSDKPRLRMRRSFELLLNSGHVVRFEAYSCKVALEWIERLRGLVRYWKEKHRVDAREEMDVAQARRARITPFTHVHKEDRDLPPEPPADPSTPLPGLGSLFNWCVIEGCKPILKGGKVYMRRSMRGHYKMIELILVQGRLVHFWIHPRSSMYKAMKGKAISLVDAYVVSGFLAAQILPAGQVDPQAYTPRRYQDGLETDDSEEDRLFIILYHSRLDANSATTPEAPISNEKIPKLSATRNMVVFRTRSKLERDAWCWALNCEIERVLRARKESEAKVRDNGQLAKL